MFFLVENVIFCKAGFKNGRKRRAGADAYVFQVSPVVIRLIFGYNENGGPAVPFHARAGEIFSDGCVQMALTIHAASKFYGGCAALSGADFCLERGEIHALLGESGAGKSTLLNILGGRIRPDAGELALEGKQARFNGPSQARRAGIALVGRENSLIGRMTVCENLFLGCEANRFGILDRRGMLARARAAFEEMGVRVDPRARVCELDDGHKQIVKIARALLAQPDYLLLDGVDAPLGGVELARVFETMRSLRARGVGVALACTDAARARQVAGRITVLRDGAVAFAGTADQAGAEQLEKYMTGREADGMGWTRRAPKIGRVRLRAEGLTLAGAFSDVSFEIRAGEIVGFTGLAGGGRDALFQTLFAGAPGYAGELYVDQSPVAPRSCAQAVRLGLGYADAACALGGLSILDAGTLRALNAFTRLGVIRPGLRKSRFMEQARELDAEPLQARALCATLSGGARQKLALAGTLCARPGIVLLNHPTRGADTAAREAIYRRIFALAAQGVAVALNSDDAREIERVCDRALVFYHGRIQGELAGARLNRRQIAALSSGGA